MSVWKKFRRPDAVHAPGYFWFLNAKMSEDDLRAQIRDMAASGARTICPHPLPRGFRSFLMSTMEPDYLTEEYFRLHKVIVDECAGRHLNCVLYDEGGWPSGGACGQVAASDPEHFSRWKLVSDGKGGVKKVPDGPLNGQALRPDVLARGAVDKFLELTHRRYARHEGRHFGRTMKFVFMDEPEMVRSNAAQLTWTPDLLEYFKAKKGYDITPHLGRVLDAGDVLPDAERYRIDFRDVCAWMFVERFMLPIRQWCREHGLLSCGHMGGEDDLTNMGTYGQILRTLRYLDAPGIDVIWRQLWMGTRLTSFPKLASGVAAQNGGKFVIGELFGVYGNGLTFDQMRFLVDYCSVCGVNTYLFCARPLATTDGLYEGERPHFGPVNPQWRHIRPLHEYIARISMLGTLGKPEVGTAFFLDTRSLWASPREAKYADENREKIAARMTERQIDFDYVDDDVLATARAERGRLRIGRAVYDRLVIPEGARIAPEAEKRLTQLRAAGVPVLSSDDIAEIPPTLRCGDWRLQVRKRRLSGGRVLYMIFNISSRRIKTTLTAEEKLPVVHCDCESGRIFRAGDAGVWTWEFAPYRTEVFLLDGSAAAETPAARPGDAVGRLTKWKLRPEVRHRAGEHDYVVEKVSARAETVKLGDWAPALGRDFSGCAVYTAEFAAAPGVRFLDLGDVRYSAEVRLNGRKLGLRLWAPYVFDLAPALREGTNRLEVRVVNTLANAVNADGVWEMWHKLPHECPYERMQRKFEQDSLSGGLFGPVTLRAEAK